jgi:hypothetical protein
MTMNGWERLGGVSRARLIEARLQLHYAAQPAAAVGKLLLPHQADFGEQSFCWSADARCLAQGPVAAPSPFRAAVRLAAPALLLLGADGRLRRELPLGGRTLSEAYDWLAAQLAELLGGSLPGELERPAGLPPHPLADGARFDAGDAEAFAELARLFANADRVLTAWTAAWPGASAVRCWPHHFDIATLAPLAPSTPLTPPAPSPEPARPPGHDPGAIGAAAAADPESASTVGAGMVPGDSGCAEPYFYVLPWPCPDDRELPPLPAGGTWNTGSWVGAILEGPRFMYADRAPEQAAAVETFLRSAGDACRRLLL